MKRIVCSLILLCLLSACADIIEIRDNADMAVNEYFGEEDIDDAPIPLSAFAMEGASQPGQVVEGKYLSYNLLSLYPSADGAYVCLELEVFNHSRKTINFNADSDMKLMAGSDYSTELSPSSDGDPNTLEGILQPNCRITGMVSFPMTCFEEASACLLVQENKKDFLPTFTLTRDHLFMTCQPSFTSQKIESDYHIGLPVESKSLTILVEGVTYEADEDGNDLALCSLTVTNNGQESALFLTGYTILNVHDMEGNPLRVDTEAVSLPKSIEPGTSVHGILPIYLSGDCECLYITVVPDDDAMDKQYMIIVE